MLGKVTLCLRNSSLPSVGTQIAVSVLPRDYRESLKGGGGAVSASEGFFCWMVGEECDLLETAAQKC